MLFLLLALATAGSALLISFTPSGSGAARSGEARTGLRHVYRDARFWQLAPLSTCCIGTSFAMQGLWAAPWLTDVGRLHRKTVVGDLFVMAVALCLGALVLGLIADRLRRRGIRARDLLAVMAALSIIAQAMLVLRLQVAPLLPWIVLAAAGDATVLSYAALADVFPKEMAGRANSALNVLHVGGAFAIQSGIGLVIGRWVPSVAGGSPPIAYTAAFGMNLVPQCLALARFVLAARPVASTMWRNALRPPVAATVSARAEPSPVPAVRVVAVGILRPEE